jgi:hypothetical protein
MIQLVGFYDQTYDVDIRLKTFMKSIVKFELLWFLNVYFLVILVLTCVISWTISSTKLQSTFRNIFSVLLHLKIITTTLRAFRNQNNCLSVWYLLWEHHKNGKRKSWFCFLFSSDLKAFFVLKKKIIVFF